ncbi:putative O-glycosylation ligase, exosortase A system-associated [Marinobacterium aestuariivivens]|uniref:O-glycosylation ligase, exosortase A system-associated n=1 Tax=Marinobacterium aestuariivivens TaxID=1698799 RepID=A0ABW1ZUH7_9GAMM
MRDILLLIIITGSIPLIFRRPFFGVLMWCWVSYMLPQTHTWGFMQSFPVAMVIGIATIVAFLMSREPKVIPFEKPIVWLFVFYLMMFLSWVLHDKTPFVNMLAMKVFKIQLMTLVILAMLTSRKRIELALLVVALSIGFYGIKGGVFTILTGGEFRVYGPSESFFEENNAMAVTNLMVAPIFVYFSAIQTDKRIKYLFLLCASLMVIAAFGSQSRGAFLTIIACALFLLAKSNKKLVSFVVILTLLPTVYAFMPDHWHQRMSTIFVDEEVGEVRDGSSASRLNAWRAGINMSFSHPFSQGFNAETPSNFLIYAPNPNDFVAFHSNYIQVLGKHGWLAFISYLMVFLFTWIMASKITRMTKNIESLHWAGLLCRYLQVSLVAYFVGGAFLSLAYFDLPYHFVITITAVYVIVKKEVSKLHAENKNKKWSYERNRLVEHTV